MTIYHFFFGRQIISARAQLNWGQLYCISVISADGEIFKKLLGYGSGRQLGINSPPSMIHTVRQNLQSCDKSQEVCLFYPDYQAKKTTSRTDSEKRKLVWIGNSGEASSNTFLKRRVPQQLGVFHKFHNYWPSFHSPTTEFRTTHPKKVFKSRKKDAARQMTNVANFHTGDPHGLPKEFFVILPPQMISCLSNVWLKGQQ